MCHGTWTLSCWTQRTRPFLPTLLRIQGHLLAAWRDLLLTQPLMMAEHHWPAETLHPWSVHLSIHGAPVDFALLCAAPFYFCSSRKGPCSYSSMHGAPGEFTLMCAAPSLIFQLTFFGKTCSVTVARAWRFERARTLFPIQNQRRERHLEKVRLQTQFMHARCMCAWIGARKRNWFTRARARLQYSMTHTHTQRVFSLFCVRIFVIFRTDCSLCFVRICRYFPYGFVVICVFSLFFVRFFLLFFVRICYSNLINDSHAHCACGTVSFKPRAFGRSSHASLPDTRPRRVWEMVTPHLAWT